MKLRTTWQWTQWFSRVLVRCFHTILLSVVLAGMIYGLAYVSSPTWAQQNLNVPFLVVQTAATTMVYIMLVEVITEWHWQVWLRKRQRD